MKTKNSLRAPFERLFKNKLRRSTLTQTQETGASLVEGLIAGVIIAVVSVMAVIAANAIIALVNSTDRQSRLSAIIDNDISRIRALSQAYNACADPSGSLSAVGPGCTGYSESSSYYYFPDPTSSSGPSDVTSFDGACESPSTSGHILEKFITAVNSTSLPAEIQKTVARQNSSDPDNNIVVVTYSAPGGILRTAKLSPYLSFWCR